MARTLEAAGPALCSSRILVWLLGNWGLFRKKGPGGPSAFPGASTVQGVSQRSPGRSTGPCGTLGPACSPAAGAHHSPSPVSLAAPSPTSLAFSPSGHPERARLAPPRDGPVRGVERVSRVPKRLSEPQCPQLQNREFLESRRQS